MATKLADGSPVSFPGSERPKSTPPANPKGTGGVGGPIDSTPDLWQSNRPGAANAPPTENAPGMHGLAAPGGYSANVRHSSETNEHYTPSAFTEAMREMVGGIDLDPASCAAANTLVQATSIFTAEDNGFTRKWAGRVWLNPPGGKCDRNGVSVTSEDAGVDRRGRREKAWSCVRGAWCGHAHDHIQSSQRAWWQKLVREWQSGRVAAAVFLSFSMEIFQTSQQGTGLLPMQFPICYPRSRIAFHRPDLTVGASPPHASALILLPGSDVDVDEFPAFFGKFGYCTRHIEANRHAP